MDSVLPPTPSVSDPTIPSQLPPNKGADSVQYCVLGTKGVPAFQAYPEPDHRPGARPAGRRVAAQHRHHGGLVRCTPGNHGNKCVLSALGCRPVQGRVVPIRPPAALTPVTPSPALTRFLLILRSRCTPLPYNGFLGGCPLQTVRSLRVGPGSWSPLCPQGLAPHLHSLVE